MKRAVALLAGVLLTSLTWADQTGLQAHLSRVAGRIRPTETSALRLRRIADDDDPIPARNEHKHKNADSHDQVVIGQDFVLNAGDAANGDVVVIRGHARIDGTLNGDLVLVGSDAKMKGTANGDFVSIASSIAFESGSILNGDFVSVLSVIHDASQATFNGDRLNLDLLSPHTLRGLGDWFSSTVLFLRPMSPWSPVSWAVALGVLVFCLAIGGVFPKLLTGTGLILRERAPASFLSGVAIVPAAALFCFLLMLTVVGILAIPLVVAALLVFALIGNAAVFNLIGESVAPKLGQKPYALYLWTTMGALICWILYCIPVIGFVAGSVVFLAGLGAFTIHILERSRVAPPAHSVPGTQPTFPGAPALATPVAATVSADRVYPQFWARLGANLIDLALLYAILDSLRLTRILIPAWVLYRFAMYVWRSTTLGGIVLNLQVQKLDGTTIAGDYSTALIRALSSLLSLLPICLGFIWILFDPQRSTWHDKISGTRVVQLRSAPQSSAAPKPGEPPAPPS